MQYRRLGKTELKVSVVGVGTWQFSGDWGKDFTQSEVDAVLSRAKELGINLLDTAECYGPHHRSEAFIGDYLSRDRREDWVVATKFGHIHQEEQSQAWSADAVRKQLEDSLQSLKTDYIDLYQFHSPTNEVFDDDDLLTMLDKQREAGRIRHLGISVGENRNNVYQTDKADELRVKAIQVVYNRLDRKPEELVFPSCLSQDLGVLARVPLAKGFLSGKYKPGAVFEDKVRMNRGREAIDRQLEEVARIQRDELPEGVPMARWALAWCLRHPAVSCVIPGCKSPEQVEDNAKAEDLLDNSESHPQAWRSEAAV